MSALRLWRLVLFSGVVLALTGLMAADLRRPPRDQAGVRMAVSAIGGYRSFIHPLSHRFVRCRYRPSCSAYAIDALEKHGLLSGGWMAVRRIASCRPGVPIGTRDPVP